MKGKKLTALLSSAVMLTACMSSFISVNADWGNYEINTDGIAYSTMIDIDTENFVDDFYLADVAPMRGTLQYGEAISRILANEEDSCKMALKFRIYVSEYNYPDEREQFMNTQTIDGQTYAEAFEELSHTKKLEPAQLEKLLKIENDTTEYISGFIAEDIALEPERLAENGVILTNFDGEYDNPALYGNYYTVLTVEELKNFPVNPHFGYDVMLTAMPGDVQTDGDVNILDVISVNKALLGKETFTASQNAAADIDRNNAIDSSDALGILKYAVGLKDTL